MPALPRASAADPDGRRESEGRHNNAALVTKELLHFGPDFIRLCLGSKLNLVAPSLRFLEAIFSLPHNDTNAAQYENMVWADTDESIGLLFGKTLHGDAAFVSWKKETIFRLEKISPQSTFYKNIKGKYQYTISFFGSFFSLTKKGLEVDLFFDLFRRDIREEVLVHCVSRLDICADLHQVTVGEISKGVIVDSPRHAKLYTPFKVNWVTGEPETWYYGETTDKHWHARVYNKIKDIEDKGKEGLFPQYCGLNPVTRLEIQLNGICQEFGITFLNCLDVPFLLSVYAKMLDTKYVHWKILPFILHQMKLKGYDPFKIEKIKLEYDQMECWTFYKRTLQKNLSCIQRLDVPLQEYLVAITKDIKRQYQLSPFDDAQR